ncbi:hypothetical protein [Parasitella parasitica]|uniref:Uncharacterized protein n=1 Tax=Parasitella parasitica TaxID=35722 RepID=A0A0B7NIQ6_9FUNG|nr:hypothetical protein [Parasitella parasitica]
MSLYDLLVYQPACLLSVRCDETVEHLFFECLSKFAFWTDSIISLAWNCRLQGTVHPHNPQFWKTHSWAVMSLRACYYFHYCHLRVVKDPTALHYSGQRFHPANGVACNSTALQKRFAEDHLSELK